VEVEVEDSLVEVIMEQEEVVEITLLEHF